MKKVKPAWCVYPCDSSWLSRTLFLPISLYVSVGVPLTHKQWSPPYLPSDSSLCPHPRVRMCRSSQYPRWDVGSQKITTTKKGRKAEKVDASRPFSSSFFSYHFHSSISLIFLSVTVLPYTVSFSLFPITFSLFLSLSLSLSINPSAVGFVELVFPPSDKGLLYRMSPTLAG